MEESAEDASWTVAGRHDNICWLEGMVSCKNISGTRYALNCERSQNFHLCEENCCIHGEIHGLQAQINDLRASGTVKGSKMENPPTKELTSPRAAGVERTGSLENSWSDDNLSLSPSSDNNGSN